jgi:hypothetical protein
MRILYLMISLCLFTQTISAQEKEFGVWAGTAVFLGDLNPNMSFKNARSAMGAFFRYNLNNRMSVRAGINYAILQAKDSYQKKYPYLLHRNLNFSSQIIEVGATYEINFFAYSTSEERKTKNWTPYIFTGGSLFYYNPTTKLNGNKYKLEYVGTEGQKSANIPSKTKGYNSYAFAIPFGMGIKYALNQNWALNFEVSSRLTFTDFIDDVSGVYPDVSEINYYENGNNIGALLYDRSTEVGPKTGIANKQRGTSSEKDRFLFVGVTLTYTIFETKCPKVF